MENSNNPNGNGRESIFLNERLMTAGFALIAVAGLLSILFLRSGMDSFEMFGVLVELLAAVAMFFSFRSYKWDAVKGLMGGVLFCLMFEDYYLVFVKLWQEENFVRYMTVGISGSLFLAGACMSFFMTAVITVNHYLISFAFRGNPKNVMLNRIAIMFKLIVMVIFFVGNSGAGVTSVELWAGVLRSLMDLCILVLLVSVESQLDAFNVLRQELLTAKSEKRKGLRK